MPKLSSAAKGSLQERLRTPCPWPRATFCASASTSLLLIQKGKELDLKVDGEVAKQLADIQRRSGIADPEKFQQFVHEQTGMPYEDYKNELKNKALMDRVIRQEVSSTHQDQDAKSMQKYYDEHKSEFQRQERIFLQEILVSTEGKDARRRAGCRAEGQGSGGARPQKGEKFSGSGASQFRRRQRAPAGGEMPRLRKGQAALKVIEDAVWDQPRGFVTEPIKVANGILDLQSRRASTRPASRISKKCRTKWKTRLFRPRMDPALREYLTKLRLDAFLEIKPGYEDYGRRAGQEHRLGGSRAAQAGNGNEGRSRRADAQQEASWASFRFPAPPRRIDRHVVFASRPSPRNEIALRHRARTESARHRTSFWFSHKDIRQKKSGEPYLSLTLADRTGDAGRQDVGQRGGSDGHLRARRFRPRERPAADLSESPAAHRPQDCSRCAESEVDFADYFPASTRDRDEMFAELRSWIASIDQPAFEGAARSDLRR